MCGIIGYLGKKVNARFLIKKLKHLEYRGYDSAGISYIENNEVVFYKSVGKIDNLSSIVPKNIEVTEAIAHTRWATNGIVNLINTHPHSSKNKFWTIVHNGIIENESIIRKNLKNKPESQTDTSVVAQLLEEKNVTNIYEFIDTFKILSGSYAIIAENKFIDKRLFVAKKNSPIFIANNDNNDYLIASDPICFADFSKKYYCLEDNEFAEIFEDKVVFYNKEKKQLKKDFIELDESYSDSKKDGYSHYMLKEILEQKSVLERQVKFYKENKILERLDKNFLKQFKDIKFVGCGTAFHASLIGAKYFQKILNINATAEMASELIYSYPIFANKEYLFIFVSQSGETADTISALEMAKNRGATTIAITNVNYSTLAKKADYILPICAGSEIAVASTKAYTAQLSVLYLLASYFSDKKNYYEDIERISKIILNFDFSKIDYIAEKIKKAKTCIFIGKDLDYITACEASLKLKEVAYICSQNYPSGELKHGFLALVKKQIPIIFFANQKQINQKTFNSANESKSRGARLIAFSNEKIVKTNKKFAIYFKEENELLLPILSIVPAQYLAYKVSILKNIDPDKPRNLAKSVTVE